MRRRWKWDNARRRLWLRRHMRHGYTYLVGDLWWCSCGSSNLMRVVVREWAARRTTPTIPAGTTDHEQQETTDVQ